MAYQLHVLEDNVDTGGRSQAQVQIVEVDDQGQEVGRGPAEIVACDGGVLQNQYQGDFAAYIASHKERMINKYLGLKGRPNTKGMVL